MKKEMMKYWSAHPIVSGLIVAAFTVFLDNCVGEPIIDHYFPVDTVSTFVDNYLVDTGYVDASVLEVESLDQQFQIIYESFAEYDEAVQAALVNMGKDQEEVSKMERAALLSELPYLADATVKSNSDKDKDIKDLNETINTLTTDNKNKQNEIDEYKKRKDADLKQSHLIIDGELMNNGDSVNNAVARVEGNNFYSESFLNTYILEEQIRYDLQENSIVVGNAKPEKVKFSWDDMVSGREGIDVYQMGGGSSFAMAKNSYTEGLVLSESDCCYVQLRGKYSKLKFTYGHIDDTERSDLELKIFAMDDNGETYTKLLKTISLKGEMNPKDVEVSLGYASAIKIVVSGGSWYPRFGLTDIYFYT